LLSQLRDQGWLAVDAQRHLVLLSAIASADER
jgi:hypothetical protein